jgi:hypothetical protein
MIGAMIGGYIIFQCIEALMPAVPPVPKRDL